MNPKTFNWKQTPVWMARLLVVALSLLLGGGQTALLAVHAQSRSRATVRHKKGEMADERRIAHVLSRLTFGARPGDFDRVKAIGVDAFIAQQLDPDPIDDSALDLKLKKLPTLALATPVIIEQYTPPKPAASPSPTPTPANAAAPSQNGTNSSAGINQEKTEPAKVTALPGAAATQGEMKARETAPGVTDNIQKADASQRPPAPKPTPPPKNPQMVVSELQRAAVLRAVYSERQLYEQMVNFWENHFSIFAYKDADRYLLTGFDRDTIRPFALGRFRDLLGATAHSPAMLFYLDNWQSSLQRSYPATKDKPARTSGGVNENYARELMELHTMGVDGGYTQQDVQEVARCFTGWTIQKPNEEGLFLYRPGAHDDGAKVVLGHRIPAGGGIADGERVLDILASHPSTARFIATKLARRFIADAPPEAIIERAAATFLKTDGSIRETLRTIITSPEFFSTTAYRAKVRTPFEYEVAALRALNAETDGDPNVVDWSKRMGQQVFGRLTPDGYPDRAEQWLAPGSMLERFNFATALATNRIKGTRIDAAGLYQDADLNTPQAVADRLTTILLAGDVSQQTRAAIEKIAREEATKPVAVSPPLTGINYLSEPKKNMSLAVAAPYVAQLISMLIGAPEFQRR